MCERRRPGVGSCVASHARVGLGTNCIERHVLSNEVRKEGGQRAEAEADAGPSQGSQSTCGTSVPSRASAGQLCVLSRTPLPALGHICLLCQHGLQPPVFGKHRRWGRPAEVSRGRRWWLAAEVWGKVARLGGPLCPLCPSLGAGCGCQAGLAWSGRDGRVLGAQKGCRQLSINSRRHRAPTFCHLGWEGFSLSFFFPVCFCPFFLLSVFSIAGSRQGASLSF